MRNGRQTLKLVMDIVRGDLGDDEGISKFYDELGESGLRRFVLEVQKRLCLGNTQHTTT